MNKMNRIMDYKKGYQLFFVNIFVPETKKNLTKNKNTYWFVKKKL